MQEEDRQRILYFLSREERALREASSLTQELFDAFERRDEVTLLLYLDMRRQALECVADKRERLTLYLEERLSVSQAQLASDPALKAALDGRNQSLSRLRQMDARLNEKAFKKTGKLKK